MTDELRAWHFVIRRADFLFGVALICPEARYASIAWRRAPRLDRKFALPATWKTLEQELAVGLAPEPLPATSTVCAVLLTKDMATATVQYMRTDPIAATDPGTVVRLLDGALMATAAEIS